MVARTLIIIGIVLVIIGLAWPLIQKVGLGRLPGDIAIERENIRFYFPLMTTLIISVIVSLLFWFFKK